MMVWFIVIVFFITFYVLPVFFCSDKKYSPSYRALAVSELLFGGVIFVGGMIAGVIKGSIISLPLSMFFGVLWMLMAFHLQAGKPIARKVCFYLSILRLFTIIGIPFSLLAFFQLRKTET